jgi:hypothetical protein
MMKGDIPMGILANISDVQFDGGEYSHQLVKGTILKCVDARWSARDGTVLVPNGTYLGLGTTEVLQRFEDGLPAKPILKEPGKDLPDVDELNAKIPKEEWEDGLDGNPRPPWQHVWIAYLIRVSDAMMFTFLNSTTGARMAVQKLASQVNNMRVFRGTNVVPIVKLSAKPMQTKFGEKMRPSFEIVDWRELAGADEIHHQPAQQIEAKPEADTTSSMIGKSVKPVTIKEELNDEINF